MTNIIPPGDAGADKRLRQNAAWIRGFLRPSTQLESDVVDNILDSLDDRSADALAGMLEAKLPVAAPMDAKARAEAVRARRDAEPDNDLEAAILRIADWLEVDANELHDYKRGEPWVRDDLRQLVGWTDELHMNIEHMAAHFGFKTAQQTQFERDQTSNKPRELRRTIDRLSPGLLEQARKLANADPRESFVQQHLTAYACEANDVLARLVAMVTP